MYTNRSKDNGMAYGGEGDGLPCSSANYSREAMTGGRQGGDQSQRESRARVS